MSSTNGPWRYKYVRSMNNELGETTITDAISCLQVLCILSCVFDIGMSCVHACIHAVHLGHKNMHACDLGMRQFNDFNLSCSLPSRMGYVPLNYMPVCMSAWPLGSSENLCFFQHLVSHSFVLFEMAVDYDLLTIPSRWFDLRAIMDPRRLLFLIKSGAVR